MGRPTGASVALGVLVASICTNAVVLAEELVRFENRDRSGGPPEHSHLRLLKGNSDNEALKFTSAFGLPLVGRVRLSDIKPPTPGKFDSQVSIT